MGSEPGWGVAQVAGREGEVSCAGAGWSQQSFLGPAQTVQRSQRPGKPPQSGAYRSPKAGGLRPGDGPAEAHGDELLRSSLGDTGSPPPLLQGRSLRALPTRPRVGSAAPRRSAAAGSPRMLPALPRGSAAVSARHGSWPEVLCPKRGRTEPSRHRGAVWTSHSLAKGTVAKKLWALHSEVSFPKMTAWSAALMKAPDEFSLDYGILPQSLNEYELHIWIMSLKKINPKNVCFTPFFFVLTFSARAHVSLAQILMKNEFQSKLPKYVKQPSFLLANKSICAKSTLELIQLGNSK
ncbi:uncharacterized protein LOC141941208 [Strix uralensis]|uniref:uncharacterized protein LOC141941208 n=1 Tax=Strix uralensis TaxID=36305 RepID=UPI003DA77CFC